MSNRSLIELNHDLCAGVKGNGLISWAEDIALYLRSGDKGHLPTGATFIAMRHHSEPEPILVTREQLEAIQWGNASQGPFGSCPECGVNAGRDTVDATITKKSIHEDGCWIGKALAK